MRRTLSPAQISGARGFLREGLVEFSQNCGISNVTLSTIEKGDTQASHKTEEKIISYVQSRGFEFSDDGGVRPSQGLLFRLRGRKAFEALYQKVYEEMQRSGTEKLVRVNNTDERKYLGWYGKTPFDHSERMVDLGVEYHIMTEYGDRYAPCAYGTYRWTPKGEFSYASDYIFGDYCGIISFKEDPEDTTIFLLQDKDIAETRKQAFDILWRRGTEVENPIIDVNDL